VKRAHGRNNGNLLSASTRFLDDSLHF